MATVVFRDYPEIEWATNWCEEYARASLELDGFPLEDAAIAVLWHPKSSQNERVFEIVGRWMLGERAKEVKW